MVKTLKGMSGVYTLIHNAPYSNILKIYQKIFF